MSLFNHQKPQPIKFGIITAILEIIYIALLISIGTCVTSTFRQNFINDQLFGPMLFLTVFVFSAAITALLILGYPAYLLVVEKKMNQAIKTLATTLLTLILFGVIVFVLLVI